MDSVLSTRKLDDIDQPTCGQIYAFGHTRKWYDGL